VLITEYRDLDVVARDLSVGESENGVRTFTVEVFDSPAGQGAPETRTTPADLQRYLGRLERRKLDFAGVVALGEALADLLFPAGARVLFTRSLDLLKPNEGLRVRLRLAPELAHIPWEYVYIARAGGEGEKDATGFLALDPRVSIVRHEALLLGADLDDSPRERRVLIALASPADSYEELNLAREREDIERALKGVPSVTYTVIENATAQSLSEGLQPGADVFHFAGHAEFEVQGLGAAVGAVEGRGALILVNATGDAAPMPADQLAVNLRGRGVQLAVLGACETGRRDGLNVWSGVVAALMEAGVPAAVAMQYKVWDDASIAFDSALYRALAAGLSLDAAASAGRLAVYNLCNPLRDDPELGVYWRDWGVPVVYYRATQTFHLPAVADAQKRDALSAGPRAVVDHRFTEIGPQGKYTAVEAGVVEAGRIESHLKVGRQSGSVVQVELDALSGGDVSVSGEAERNDGEWVGLRIGSLGSAAPRSLSDPTPAADPPRDPAMEDASTTQCPNCGAQVEPGARFCLNCGARLQAQPSRCANCGAALLEDAAYCTQCGTKV